MEKFSAEMRHSTQAVNLDQFLARACLNSNSWSLQKLEKEFTLLEARFLGIHYTEICFGVKW
jgi:hypothetical protein